VALASPKRLSVDYYYSNNNKECEAKTSLPKSGKILD
jgi:hypothetical protein